LNNGCIVTIGQPFAGLTMVAGGSVTVQVGIIPILSAGLSNSSPAQIEPARSLINGRFQMTFPTKPGINYVVQASTNLINWDSIWTNASPGGSLLFEDPQTTNFLRRFYRVMNQ